MRMDGVQDSPPRPEMPGAPSFPQKILSALEESTQIKGTVISPSEMR